MTMRRSIVPLLAASALALAACTTGSTRTNQAEPQALPSPEDATVVQARNPVERVVERVLPAVVNVVADGGEGTGFIIRDDGVIVTNYHVVEGASSVQVLTSEESPREFPARVIGGDVQADLAVLDVEAQDLPTVPLGDSGALELGQQVVAIGYALGLEGGPSVTSGIVSSLTREITVPDPNCAECEDQQRVYADVIQTDAAINPGNSGGPLVDLAGNVVGINSAGSTGAENIGFAIQINSAKPTIFQAADNPGEPVAFMGVSSTDASDPEFQFQFNSEVDEGAGVVEVVPDGPAEAAGVEVGDVIVSFGGDPVSTSIELGEAIRSHDPGEVVDVEVIRADGERVTLTVELGENPVAIG
ncbi:MAG TPA: trypsin-like peptidase domain-containing protein [Actinomycetota bacterium]|nr:trypsin-like peptidase domain-containing protein [Actinomycetota bacterium]